MAVAGVLAAYGESTGPDDPDFLWSAAIDHGEAIEVKGVNESINAGATSGISVTVAAVKDGRQSDPDVVLDRGS